MICLECDHEAFTVGEAEVRQEFRGESLLVKTPVMVCSNCGWHTVGNDQIDELRQRTADAYRKAHGLLTSAQIKAMRQSLKMTQRQFADFLRVGEASVKRWKTWLVQDASSDELVRVKCVLAKRMAMLRRVCAEFLRRAPQAPNLAEWSSTLKEGQSLLRGLEPFSVPRLPQPDPEPFWKYLKVHIEDRPLFTTSQLERYALAPELEWAIEEICPDSGPATPDPGAHHPRIRAYARSVEQIQAAQTAQQEEPENDTDLALAA